MSAVGRWKVIMTLPIGEQEMTLHVERADTTLAGRAVSAMGEYDISGQVEGERLRWEMKEQKPIPITLTFDVRVQGDVLVGEAKLGMFGKAKVMGERLADDTAVTSLSQAEAEQQADRVTETSVDPQFQTPYVDVDEWRDTPARHRYVRGGFEGTDARFSIYFPPKEQYGGRFFHNTYPLITSSDIGPFPIQFDVAVGDLGFTLDSGAYYLQTNLGGQDRAPPADPAIAAYRVNAAAAKISRGIAAQMYGEHRPYGYLFGGSGGSFQVMGSAEMTEGVWDGFLPYVLGTPHAIPSMFTIRQHAMRVLRRRGKLAGIADAMDAGGSGDPYAGLNEEETAALREASRMGFPLRGWWSQATMKSGYYSTVAPITPMLDPTYVEDFWTTPGYLGADPEGSIHEGRFTFVTEVAEIIEGPFREVVLASVPDRPIAEAHLMVLEGERAGSGTPIASADGARLGFAMAADHVLLASLRPGDRVRIDNSWTLAMQTYHRHQLPPADHYAWDQFRDAAGDPAYPQRDVTIGLVGAANTAGCIPEGRISGKMLALACLLDVDALPWQADWYRSRVEAALGPRFSDDFALWFIDNAGHENPLTTEAHAHLVSFSGALQQGLRDLAAWVEDGRHPGNTRYHVEDGQIVVPDRAADRGGVQPTLDLTANGSHRAEVRVGEEVRFQAHIETAAGSSLVVSAEWDFKGLGRYAEPAAAFKPGASVRLTARHAYSEPGTYFAVLRVAANRQGGASTLYARVPNLARVRVVVS